MGKPEKSGSSKKSSKLSASKSVTNFKTAKEGQPAPCKSPKSDQQKRCKTQGNTSSKVTVSTGRSPTQKSKELVSPSKVPPPESATLKRSPAKAKELAPMEPSKSVRRKESLKQQMTKNHGKSPGLEMHGSTFVNKINRDDSALALLMHTARDGEIKRVETEIFSPGKGNLRSTQPEAHEEESSLPKSNERL